MSWMLAMYLLFFFSGPSAAKEPPAKQEPIVIIAEEGESVSMVCEFDHRKIIGLYLKRTLGTTMNVLYASEHGQKKVEAPGYKNRTEYSELNSTVTITLQEVKKNDSGVYECEGSLLINKEPKKMNSSYIILAVKGKENAIGTVVITSTEKTPTEHSSSSWMLYVLIVMSLMMVSVLGYFFLSSVNIKRYCKKGKRRETQNTVYEDMSYSLRRNTMTVLNPYQT